MLWFLFFAAAAAWPQTALDRYVGAPDPAYKFEVVRTFQQGGAQITVIDLTSQMWRAEADPAVWRHRLTICTPAEVKSRTGFLYLAEGDNPEPMPKKANALLPYLAKWTGTVTAELRMLPNQPTKFAGENGRARREDEIVAYTWTKYLETGDERWPIRLPMTKAAVRAMDTITAHTKAVDRFVVAGVSKRGWTTWLTAAVDKRVAAIVPIVIDGLHLLPTLREHYQAYGGWSAALRDYHETGFLDQLGTARYEELMRIEEPYGYRERFTMPKLLINAAGDQFFLPDSTRFYFGELPGERRLRYVPNTDHALTGKTFDVFKTVVAFYQAVLAGTPRPEFVYAFPPEGGVRVECRGTQPAEVRLWEAANPRARDFRLQSIGKAFRARKLAAAAPGVYAAAVAPPREGWKAYFVELVYPKTGRYPLKFTTEVKVAPDRLPYPAPEGKTRMER